MSDAAGEASGFGAGPAGGAGTIEAVAIGGSAGGIDALFALLPAFGAGLGVAVFVVLHRRRERPSVLRDIVAARCALDVREAQDKEPVVPGTLYIAPPDYHLLIEQGPALALSVDAPQNYSRPAIDPLFESAADVYGPRLAGVVLSGANHDGAHGLAAVRRAGGAAFVQSPASASSDAMPLAALEAVPDARSLDLAALRDALAAALAAGAAPAAPLRGGLP